MARLPALIATLVELHPHLDESAVRYAARSLRTGEQLSAGPGGRGAPHMTVRDAVNLLLALNLALTPGEYVNAALKGAALTRPEDNAGFADDTPGVVVEAMTVNSLGGALAVLIRRAEELREPRIRQDPFADPARAQRRGEAPAVEVQLVQQGDDILASVTMLWRGASGHARMERRYGVRSGRPGYGRWTTVHFDEAMFLALKRTVVEAPPWAFAAAASD